jgi:transposase-like protein
MDTTTCPQCLNENAFFRILDEQGAHYECPDCEYEWCDKSVKIVDEDDEEY